MSGIGNRDQDLMRIAEAVREACVQAAIDGYRDASISGLCHEGACECAIDAIRMLDMRVVVDSLKGAKVGQTDGATG